MKSIIKGLGTALKAVFKAILTAGKLGLSLALAPIEYLNGMFAGGSADELPEPEGDAPQQYGYSAQQVENDPEIKKAIDLNPLARIFALFLVRPDDRKSYSLAGIDPGLAAWARTLPQEEVVLLKRAGLVRTISHALGEHQVAGVRLPLGVKPVQSLTSEPVMQPARRQRYVPEPAYQAPQPRYA